MKINLVTTDTGWVLRNLADNYAKHLPNAKVSVEPDLTADINFYFNYVLFDHKTTIDVGYFTHRELHDEYLINKFDSTAREMDWCISMCNKTTEFLPKEKTTTIHSSPDPIFLNQKEKIIFGIIGKEKPSGRKRYDWIEKLREIEGVEILATNGEYEFSQMPEFYKKIDYVLILSDNEGGPLCLYEGLNGSSCYLK